MKNLIVGSTSQLTPYLLKIDPSIELHSSRNFSLSNLKESHYSNVIILFAEQRTFLNETLDFYTKINVDLTCKIINDLSNISDNIVVFGTSELWNKYDGGIDINLPFSYHPSNYVKSKELFITEINSIRQTLKSKIKILHPFNYNTPYRKDGFLFNKLIKVILNKEKVSIGDINIFRDITHPKLVAEACFNANDEIVGSGCLINVKDFFTEVLKHFNIEFNEYITENIVDLNKRSNYFLNTKNKYNNLIKDTIDDIEEYKHKIN
jgi:nucleoside-diphosphate-sugar epimerase